MRRFPRPFAAETAVPVLCVSQQERAGVRLMTMRSRRIIWIPSFLLDKCIYCSYIRKCIQVLLFQLNFVHLSTCLIEGNRGRFILNFDYCAPTRVIFGRDEHLNTGRILSE